MLYTNYKQVAKIILASEYCTERDTSTKTVNSNAEIVVNKYVFNVNLPFYKFSKTTKLAVESFSFLSADLTASAIDIGSIFITNIKKSNVYHSNPSLNKGTCLLSINLSKSINYINPDVINNSIEITGNTGFMEGNPIEIIVDTKIGADTTADDINGCLDDCRWSLTLIVYEEEKEENAKDFVDDRTKNFSKPSSY